MNDFILSSIFLILGALTGHAAPPIGGAGVHAVAIGSEECSALLAPRDKLQAIDELLAKNFLTAAATERKELIRLVEKVKIEAQTRARIEKFLELFSFPASSPEVAFEGVSKLALKTREELLAFAMLFALKFDPSLAGDLYHASRTLAMEPLSVIETWIRSPRAKESRVQSRISLMGAQSKFRLRSDENITEDHWAIKDVLRALARAARSKGHSLDVNAYVERHISAEVFSFFLSNPDIEIKVIESEAELAFAQMEALGFTDAHRLHRSRVTDFDQYLATNRKTGEAAFVIVSLRGRSYRKEAIANLLYYEKDGKRLDPARIKVLASSLRPRDLFGEILKGEAVDPDIVTFAYASNLRNTLSLAGIKPKKTIRVRELYGHVYDVKGKQVLSVSIEPEMFGDRASELVRAAQGLSKKTRAFVMLGTAGSMDARVRIGDYVIPETFSADGASEGEPIHGVENHALGLAPVLGAAGANVIPGGHHIAVDTILFEDAGWLKRHTTGKGRARKTIVEQEGADLARAVREGGGRFYAVYRISDELTTGNDFSAHENAQTEADSLRLQNIQKILFEHVLNSLPGRVE